MAVDDRTLTDRGLAAPKEPHGRVMVIACGQMALFWTTRVAGLLLGVHEPEGPVLLSESSPLHEIAAASVSAAAVPQRRVLRFRIS